jgi:hypothetical protein
MPHLKTAKEIGEALEFAEQTKEAMTFLKSLTAPVIKAVGGAVKKLPIGKPAMQATMGSPLGIGGSGTPAQAATGLYKWGPRLAAPITALPAYAAKKPIPFMMGSTAAVGIPSMHYQGAQDIKNQIGDYTDGVSTGAAQAMHGFANAPWYQRGAAALFPKAVLGSQGLADMINTRTQTTLKDMSPWVQRIIGGSLSTGIQDKLQRLNSGESLDFAPRARELSNEVGTATIERLQNLMERLEQLNNKGQAATTTPPA